MICPNCFDVITAPTYDECSQQFAEHYEACFTSENEVGPDVER